LVAAPLLAAVNMPEPDPAPEPPADPAPEPETETGTPLAASMLLLASMPLLFITSQICNISDSSLR
jgi:hypothetical protein